MSINSFQGPLIVSIISKNSALNGNCLIKFETNGFLGYKKLKKLDKISAWKLTIDEKNIHGIDALKNFKSFCPAVWQSSILSSINCNLKPALLYVIDNLTKVIDKRVRTPS